MEIRDVSGIVWDLDGTLLDSFSIFGQIITDVVAKSGHAMPSRNTMLVNYHGSLEDTIQSVLGLKSAEELAGVVDSFLTEQEHHYAGDLNTHLFNDATMLAQQAAEKGILQLLVTNRFHKNRGNASPRAIVAATVLADCIQEVRAGDELEYRKPDKRTVMDWLVTHDILPEKLLIIGDQHVDAQLAVNIGARALLVRRNDEIPSMDTVGDYGDKLYVVDSLHGIVLDLAVTTKSD